MIHTIDDSHHEDATGRHLFLAPAQRGPRKQAERAALLLMIHSIDDSHHENATGRHLLHLRVADHASWQSMPRCC